MSDELAEAAFLAGVPRWTDALAKLNRDKKYGEAEVVAWKLADGYLMIAQRLAQKQEA